MALGFGCLGLSPSAFWAMTPRELEAAMSGHGAMAFSPSGAPARSDLHELMRQFPDHRGAQ